MTAIAFKADTLYIACSPELGAVSFGHCQDEALNNLAEAIREHETAGHERSTKGNTDAIN